MVQRMVVARHACLKVAPSTSIVVASESEAISGRHSLDRSGLRRRASAPNKKKEHNLATMRRGYPAFFVQGGSAAGRWETRNDGKVSHCERSEEISIRIKALRINRAIRDLVG